MEHREFYMFRWNGLENVLAYITRRFETHLTIYRSPLYAKIDMRYKWEMDYAKNGTLWFSVYISRLFSRTTESDISLDALRKAECHKLENGGDVNTVFVHAPYGTRCWQQLCAHR